MINDSEKILKIIDDLQGDDRLIASPKVCIGIAKIREIVEAINPEIPNSSEPKQAESGSIMCISERKTHDRTTGDLISRQAAIAYACSGIVRRMEDGDWRRVADIREDLESMPSAQSESFEWCHDCKEYDQEQHCCHRWTKVIRKTVEELRQTQPERKKGEWIYQSKFGRLECCVCGHVFKSYVYPRNYCPNCGCRMEGDAE